MKKLKLSPETLRVESFSTAVLGARAGTVRGHDDSIGAGCTTGTSCFVTGCDTCDNSLDYCTCACTADCPAPSSVCETRGTTCRCV